MLITRWHFSFFRTDDAVALYVDVNTRIQILDTMTRLPRADKEQCAAFIVSNHIFLKK